MPHGGPDWGLIGPKEVVYGLDDMAELATRLGSPVSYDRRGDVMFFDDFSEGLAAWTYGAAGATSTRILECKYGVTGPYGVFLVAGNANLNNSYLYHIMYYPQSDTLGAEMSCMPVEDLNSFRIHIMMFDGTNLTRFRARYRHTDGTLWIYTFGDIYVQVAVPGVQREGNCCFFTWKMVVDVSTGYFVRLLFNDTEYDISQYRGRIAANATARSMSLDLCSIVDGDHTIYPVIDRIVLTQNEPIEGA